MEELRGAAGLPQSLRALGVPESALPALAEEAARQWTAGFNPVPVQPNDFEMIYQAALG